MAGNAQGNNRRGAPHLTPDVQVAYWGHDCRITGNREFIPMKEGDYTLPSSRLRGIPCPKGCGYTTNDGTELFNSQHKRIETFSGLNFLPNRFDNWWMLCCSCWNWQSNGLGDNNPMGTATAKVIGVNCCAHCSAVDHRGHVCPEGVGGCSAYNMYGELNEYMSSKHLPINSVQITRR